MPITQDRMLRLITAAETYRQKIKSISDWADIKRLGLDDYTKQLVELTGATRESPIGQAIVGILQNADELITEIRTPIEPAIAETVLAERAHFKARASSNNAARRLKRRQRGKPTEGIELTERGTFDYGDAPKRDSQTILRIKEKETEDERENRIRQANDLRSALFDKAIAAGLTQDHLLVTEWEMLVEILDQRLFGHQTDATLDDALESAKRKGLTPDHPLTSSFDAIAAAIQSQDAPAPRQENKA